MKRPPLPNARRLSDEERARIEQELLAEAMVKLNVSASEISIYVGRTTDGAGEPQVSVQITPPKPRTDHA